ncbi:unnamed protein product, partial [marine sediment metagenome]
QKFISNIIDKFMIKNFWGKMCEGKTLKINLCINIYKYSCFRITT